MTVNKRWFFILIFLSASSGLYADSPTPQQILTKTDAIRFPGGDHHFEAWVTFHKPDRHDQTGHYEVYTKGQNSTLIEILEPATDHGNSLLMVGHDLWIFIRDVSQPLRVSFQQRLLGDVANGDLARANFIADYTPTLIKQNQKYYVLQLSAKTDDVTYSKIFLEVEKQTYRPFKAQFFAASGKLLKIGTFENFKMVEGLMRPTQVTFENPLLTGQRSIIRYGTLHAEPIPGKYFTKDYLKKLKY